VTVPRARHRVVVEGVVQGVGFRPFVYALARELGLSGRVSNTGSGVAVSVEGDPADLASFERRVRADAPPLAVVERVDVRPEPLQGGTEFVIGSSGAGPARTLVSPDVATCVDCVRDLTDPAGRRYRHPFVTCTSCGPRFTVVTGLPYDRPATTMAGFPMCPDCAREYADPTDRRFHAQPIACPACGPTVRLTRPGRAASVGDAAVAEARRLLLDGAVVAVKGLGGFHLACDATDPAAVSALRKRKHRGDKPFAVMVGSLDQARRVAHVSPADADLLAGPRAPIVLVRRRSGPTGGAPLLVDEVAPGNPDIGLMLPYTPLHHLLLGLPGDPPGSEALVLTSGNLAGEPLVTDDEEARTRLAGIADAWLGHDRPVHVPCDDSVLRTEDGEERPVRRSRGYAPFPLSLPFRVPPALATGGDLKNTFCVGDGHHAWMSAHVGDMDDLATQDAFGRALSHLTALTGVTPTAIATDLHPGYRTRRWADREAAGRPVVHVQHHHAHVASTMAEHGLDGRRPVLGVAFDGTGYGDDGAVWGGEFLVADYDGYERAAHLGYVPLPGGDAAVRNPCRVALSHLRCAGVGWDPRLAPVRACSDRERDLLSTQLHRGFGCVPTSSMGRLFDAVSSLADVRHRVDYEAQAAIELEGAARGGLGEPDPDGPAYAFGTGGGDRSGPVLVDAAPVVSEAAADALAGLPAAEVAVRFHRGVAAMVAEVADQVRDRTGVGTVALTGGVFVNRLLSGWSARHLADRGFTVLRHRKVPPSDAGLALGQLAVLAHRRRARRPGAGPHGEETPCA
jgi:hydrogenase maturation protein HypF